MALFFQQTILCYKMPFVFSAKGADDQIGVAKATKLSNQTKTNQITQKREAAHSSTIPTLLAKAKDNLQGSTFVYLKGGSSDAQHNATIGMHVDVNGADELLDDKAGEELRSRAIKILNRVADGLSPVEATKIFLKKFEKEAKKACEKLQPQDVRKAVLESYIEGIQAIANQMESDETIFDHLIGVNIDEKDPNATILRKVIYQNRYDIIRLQEVVESRIGKKIDDAKKNIKSKYNLEYALLKEFSNSNQRIILEKLFCKTAVIFEKEYQENLNKKENKTFKSFQTKINNFQKNNKKLLDDLKRELRNDFKELSSAEQAYRSNVFKDLRTKVKHWTQKQFCDEYNRHMTDKKISPSWVSRMEQMSRIPTQMNYKTPLTQRRKIISLEEAQNCAKTFEIDAGLFLPCLITSS